MNDNNYDKSFEDIINEIEKHLGLPQNFSHSLIEEDDWTFIIKSHVLLEASVSYVLSRVTKEPKLIDVFSKLEMSNPRTGKIAFIKALNLLDRDSREFIRKLSEVRNQIVHSIKNVNFNLDSYVNSLDSNQKKSFGNAIKYFQPSDEFEYRGETFKTFDWAINNPKKSIWFSLLNLVSVVYLQKDIYHLRKQNEELKSKSKQLQSQLESG